VSINGGPRVRVDAIEKFRKKIDEAATGENVGLVIKGIEKNQLDRGDVLTSSSLPYGEAQPI
jgi:translation elongation factor EF-Tu-like GTPase